MTSDYKLPELLTEYLNDHKIQLQPVSGGDINDAYKVVSPEQTLFVKVNSGKLARDMFEQEKVALLHMKEVMNFVPTPIEVLISSDFSCLLMTYIPESRKDGKTGQRSLAECLAKLHGCKHHQFGYASDNYIGSLPQVNDWKSSWSDFYISNRLEPQVRLAFDRGLLSTPDLSRFKSMYKHLTHICIENEKPCLIHGDLWGGNYLVDASAQAWLIDPAVYFGDREVDIAMTQLFGGFSADFYRTYHELYPLRNGYEDRLPYYKLYYLLVHLNLFGPSYYSSVKSILDLQ